MGCKNSKSMNTDQNSTKTSNGHLCKVHIAGIVLFVLVMILLCYILCRKNYSRDSLIDLNIPSIDYPVSDFYVFPMSGIST